jgi:hypothetical protein
MAFLMIAKDFHFANDFPRISGKSFAIMARGIPDRPGAGAGPKAAPLS